MDKALIAAKTFPSFLRERHDEKSNIKVSLAQFNDHNVKQQHVVSRLSIKKFEIINCVHKHYIQMLKFLI